MSLTFADYAMFKAIGVTPYTAEKLAQVRRVTHREAHDDCGIRYKNEHLEGLAFPFLDPEDGKPVAWSVRRDNPELDSDGKPIAKWVSSMDRKHLYFVPSCYSALSNTSIPAILVESPKSVLAIADAAVSANRTNPLAIGLSGCWGGRGVVGKTTNHNGVRVDQKGWLPDFDKVEWTGRDTIFCLDANAATNPDVQKAERATAAMLEKRGAVVRIARVPIEDGINGPDDYIGKYGSAAFWKLIDSAVPFTTAKTDDTQDGEAKDSQATILVRLAREAGAEFFHDDDTPYISVCIGDHRETHKLRSRGGKAWLVSLFMDKFEKSPGSQAIADATNTLEALALRGLEERVYVRIAAADDGKIYIDLVDATWRCIEINRTSWRIISNPPVRFRRPKGLLPLPVPQSGGRVSDLRKFVNVKSDDDFVLLVSLLVAWLRGRGPYPVLVENGEQGSAKSTLTRLLKALIDPNAAPLRSSPREPRDLMIAAANNHILGFDNLSDIPAWLSDAFCRLSTGGGFSTRLLYSDDEEQIFDAVRPLVLNGIPDFASRQDLVGRAVFVTMPPIAETHRRDETTFWAEFEQARPYILGALLDVVSVAIRNESMVKLDRLPRMADFARWITAAEPACPWEAGTFMAVYAGNRESAIEATLDGDPLADFVRALGPWEGTAKGLLVALNEKTPESIRNQKDWFKLPRQLADALRRLAPALRQVGIDVTFTRQPHTRRRTITLEKIGSGAVPSSPAVQGPELRAKSGDADGDAGDAGWDASSPKTSIGDAGDAEEPLFSAAEAFDL